jgi:hypothetical protein
LRTKLRRAAMAAVTAIAVVPEVHELFRAAARCSCEIFSPSMPSRVQVGDSEEVTTKTGCCY